MNSIYRTLFTLVVLAALALVPAAANAQSCTTELGPNYILDALDECVNIHDGAQIRQGIAVNAGTGNLDPFLRISKGGNGVILHGINGDGTLNYDEDNSWTHALLLSAVSPYMDPSTSIIYREFVLDINQSANPGQYYPINDVRVYVAGSGNLNGSFVAPDNFPGATKVWDLDNGLDNAVLLDYDFEAGSGNNPDMILRIPDSKFQGEGYCAYGEADCQTYVYLYSRHGAVNEVIGATVPLEAGTAGFEEWATFVKPFAEVSKTAVADVGEHYDWTVDKGALSPGCSAWAGGSCDVDYEVDVTKTPFAVEVSVSGDITIHVPTIFPVTGATIKTPLFVSEVRDLLGDVDYSGSITCPSGDSFTLNPGETEVCSYSFVLSEAQYLALTYDEGSSFPNNLPTNLAIAIGMEEGTDGNPIYTPFASDPTDVEAGGFYAADGAILFVDVFDTPEGETEDDLGDATHTTPGSVEVFPFPFDNTFECSDDAADYGEGSNYSYDRNNVADIRDGATILDDDDADVTIQCWMPSIAKTADGSYDELYEWTITKTVSPESADLFVGAPAVNPEWTIDLVRTGPVLTNFQVEGIVSVTNPSADLLLEADLADLLSDGTAGVFGAECEGGVVVVAAGQTVDCSYTAEPADQNAETNTATATMESGFEFSDTADVAWTANVVNDAVTVTDSNKPAVETPFAGSGDWTYSDIAFECPTDPAEYVEGLWSTSLDNVATIVETEQSDDAEFTLNCYAPVVAKDAETSYDRSWEWTIVKSAANQLEETVGAETWEDAGLVPVTLQGANQSYLVTYTLVIQAVSEESGEKVWGDISVTNPHPTEVMSVSVADLLPDAIGLELACEGTLDVDPLATATCGYTADLPTATVDRLNTATVTLNAVDFTATADVTFGAPETETDRCVSVEDVAGPLEVLSVVDSEVCAIEAGQDPVGDGEVFDADYSYDVQFGGSDPGGSTTWIELEDCVPYEHPNVARLVGDDEAVLAQDPWWIMVEVGCPGCTLTQGYWRTHNPSFRGGAPEDITWTLLFFEEPPCDPENPTAEDCGWDQDELFLNSPDLSYFGTMWTPPKGGNPYFRLAHQFIAAQLNVLAGAFTPTEVDDALVEAEALLTQYSGDPDALVVKGKGKNNPANEQLLLDGERMGYLAGLFAAFNEGGEFTTEGGMYYEVFGPGHCDEDGTELLEGTDAVSLVNVAGSVEAAISIDGFSEVGEAASERGAVTKVDVAADDLAVEEVSRIDAAPAAVEIPSEFAVGNYPNPFNPVTTIQVALPEASHVRVAVYDVLGRMVQMLVDGQLSAGTHSVTFDAGSLPSGVYLYRFEHAGGAVTRTMQLLK